MRVYCILVVGDIVLVFQINKQAQIGYLRIGFISTFMVLVYLLKIYSVQYL